MREKVTGKITLDWSSMKTSQRGDIQALSSRLKNGILGRRKCKCKDFGRILLGIFYREKASSVTNQKEE